MQSILENNIVTTVANTCANLLCCGKDEGRIVENKKFFVLTAAKETRGKKKSQNCIRFYMKSKRVVLILCMNEPQKKKS